MKLDNEFSDPRVKGIDVSDNNGEFNWTPWVGHIDFAGIKATEGIDILDREFARNWQAVKEMNAYRWAYHYFHPKDDPSSQARFFVERVRAVGLDHGDNFFIDLETNDADANGQNGVPPHEVSFGAWVFCREVQKLAPRHRVVVYTYPLFAEAGNTAMLGERYLWIANYNVPLPEVPPPWGSGARSGRGWAFWQESAGFRGSPDVDVFNGSRKDLEKFCDTTGHS